MFSVRENAPLDHGARDLRLLDGGEAVLARVVLQDIVPVRLRGLERGDAIGRRLAVGRRRTTSGLFKCDGGHSRGALSEAAASPNSMRALIYLLGQLWNALTSLPRGHPARPSVFQDRSPTSSTTPRSAGRSSRLRGTEIAGFAYFPSRRYGAIFGVRRPVGVAIAWGVVIAGAQAGQ